MSSSPNERLPEPRLPEPSPNVNPPEERRLGWRCLWPASPYKRWGAALAVVITCCYYLSYILTFALKTLPEGFAKLKFDATLILAVACLASAAIIFPLAVCLAIAIVASLRWANAGKAWRGRDKACAALSVLAIALWGVGTLAWLSVVLDFREVLELVANVCVVIGSLAALLAFSSFLAQSLCER